MSVFPSFSFLTTDDKPNYLVIPYWCCSSDGMIENLWLINLE